MKKWILILGLMLGGAQMLPLEAQCPMCRISAESNLKNGGSEGRGLNAGILFILSLPYMLVGGIAFVWYRNRTKTNDHKNDLTLDNLDSGIPINS